MTNRDQALKELTTLGAISNPSKFLAMPQRDFDLFYAGFCTGLRQSQKMLHEVEEYRPGVHLYMRDHEGFVFCPFCKMVLDLVEV